jgi:hypothetical protein
VQRQALLLPRRGDEREKVLFAVSRWSPHLQQRSSVASSRRISTALLSPYPMAERQPLYLCVAAANLGRSPFFWRISTAPLSPYLKAGRRPLHPRVTASSCPQGNNYLRQAFLPTRRIHRLVGVGSHFCTPSGFVPDGAEVDSGELRRGEDGAGPDCFFLFYLEVLNVICKGWLVSFYFFLALSVKCNSTAQKIVRTLCVASETKKKRLAACPTFCWRCRSSIRLAMPGAHIQKSERDNIL